MTQNDCMDSKREDVKLKEMRMAPDKVCPGPCPVVAVAEGGGGPLAPSGVPLAVPVALISCPAAPQPPKEGDGASEAGGVEGVAGEGEKGVCEDDDLTSLSWLLQDKNILKGINLRTGAASGAQESPTSDYVDDSASEQGDSTCSSVNSSSPVPPHGAPSSGSGKNKHPHHIPYDPKVHVTSKPPYSFSCLIFMAIEDCALKALPVKEIYAWILDHFPYYKNAPTGWKNSVRHNLSLNKCFCKVEKAPNLGKGSLWMVDPVYRPNLVQALKKAPYHPYAVMGTGSERSVSGRTSQPPDSLSGEQSDDVISTPNSKSCAAEPQEPGRLLPDPDLFPYLSRRLLAAAAAAAAAADHPAVADGEDSQLDDVDAAAAMLALKHGPHVRMSLEQRKDEYHKQLTAVNLTSKGKKKSKDEEQDVLITSCPSEDHTYSVEHTQALHTDMYTYRFTNNNNNNTTTLTTTARDIVKTEPTSPDEAFQEGSDSNSSWAVRAAKANGNRSTAEVLGGGGERDVEEQRKIAEGADALLNLAGIATSLRRSRSSTAHAAAAKRQRLQVEQDVEREDGEMEEDEEDEDRLVIKEEIKMEEDEEEDREVERVPFRPRLLRKSPMKRDLMRRELERKREKKACMKVLSYAQAIMDSMEKNNNNNSSTTTNTSSSNHHLSPPSLMTSSPTKVGGAKVRRKSLLTPVKHVAKVKR